MYSIAFPDMFTSSRTKLVSDHEATASNLRLVLASHKTGLFGDPYFGSNLKRFLFNQNSAILEDIVIDDIYSTIQTFMPQVRVSRDDITLHTTGIDLYATIKALNLIDYTVDTYSVQLMENTEV